VAPVAGRRTRPRDQAQVTSRRFASANRVGPRPLPQCTGFVRVLEQVRRPSSWRRFTLSVFADRARSRLAKPTVPRRGGVHIRSRGTGLRVEEAGGIGQVSYGDAETACRDGTDRTRERHASTNDLHRDPPFCRRGGCTSHAPSCASDIIAASSGPLPLQGRTGVRRTGLVPTLPDHPLVWIKSDWTTPAKPRTHLHRLGRIQLPQQRRGGRAPTAAAAAGTPFRSVPSSSRAFRACSPSPRPRATNEDSR